MDSRTLTNKQLVVVALYYLGAAERAIDTEDLAMKMAELAPGKFRWKKYPEQINLDAVRLSAKHALEENPPYVVGGIRNGWMLTPEGIEWCFLMLGQTLIESDVNSGRSVLATVRSTDCWRKWERGEQGLITVYDVRRLLKVDEYTTPRRRRERIQAVRNAAGSDQDLDALVTYLAATYPEEWS
jgi:hypothetical protein